MAPFSAVWAYGQVLDVSITSSALLHHHALRGLRLLLLMLRGFFMGTLSVRLLKEFRRQVTGAERTLPAGVVEDRKVEVGHKAVGGRTGNGRRAAAVAHTGWVVVGKTW